MEEAKEPEAVAGEARRGEEGYKGEEATVGRGFDLIISHIIAINRSDEKGRETF